MQWCCNLLVLQWVAPERMGRELVIYGTNRDGGDVGRQGWVCARVCGLFRAGRTDMISISERCGVAVFLFRHVSGVEVHVRDGV